MMVLIRYWRSLTKKDSTGISMLDMKYKIFSTFILDLGRFFGQSGSGLRKESDPDPGKNRSETLVSWIDKNTAPLSG